MWSHTVPKRLLKNFAYYNTATRSLRLWQYKKDCKPWGELPPRDASAIEGHFADPTDATAERYLESELNRISESPVNAFLDQTDDPTFVPNAKQKQLLAKYVTLLFNRTASRRRASGLLRREINKAYDHFVNNEWQMVNVAVKKSIALYCRGESDWIVTPNYIAGKVLNWIYERDPHDAAQQSFLNFLRTSITTDDPYLLDSEFRFIRTTENAPFIISDAPVITWRRLEGGMLSHGWGFTSIDLEVLLPLSPRTCLHLIPAVRRTLPVQEPTVHEVNFAQAAFATEACFANINSSEIDSIVQANINTVRLVETGFKIWHIDYGRTVYEHLMRGSLKPLYWNPVRPDRW